MEVTTGQAAIAESPGRARRSAEALQASQPVTSDMWGRLKEVIGLIDQVDKQGTKLYEELSSKPNLSSRGKAFLNELEDHSNDIYGSLFCNAYFTG